MLTYLTGAVSLFSHKYVIKTLGRGGVEEFAVSVITVFLQLIVWVAFGVVEMLTEHVGGVCAQIL